MKKFLVCDRFSLNLATCNRRSLVESVPYPVCPDFGHTDVRGDTFGMFEWLGLAKSFPVQKEDDDV